MSCTKSRFKRFKKIFRNKFIYKYIHSIWQITAAVAIYFNFRAVMGFTKTQANFFCCKMWKSKVKRHLDL